MQVLTITNHKGGVGKTTTSANLGAALAQLGERVLLVDLDAQSNLSIGLLGDLEEAPSSYICLKEKSPLKPIEIVPGLDIVPGSLELSGLELELGEQPGRAYLLRNLLKPLEGLYSYVLLDTPPALGLLTVNAIAASQGVLIPLQPHFYALQGLKKLLEVVEAAKEGINPELQLIRVFIAQYDSRKVLHKQVAEAVAGYRPGEVLRTKVRDNIALAEAPSLQLDIFRYKANSHGAQDYLALAKEVQKLFSNKKKRKA